MKVGIVTLTSINYGNRLQNYAVQEVIREMGYEVYTFQNPFDENFNIYIHKFKNIIKYILFNKKYGADIQKEKTFAQFDKKYICYGREWLNNKKDVEKLNANYDFFVCGSDQIWNPTSERFGANHFLRFADSHKRIAFAPSFGVVDFPERRREEYAEYLEGFETLSVREESGADIVEELIGKRPFVMIDPTLMIQEEKWNQLCKKPKWLSDKPYILDYALGKQDSKSVIDKIAEENGLEVIRMMDSDNEEIYSSGPEEFLYLIKNSNLVVTDSFHGTVFSILFKKPVIIVKREDEMTSMYTRLENLLKLFGLENRTLENVVQTQKFFEINYEPVESILACERKKAQDYIENCFRCDK